MRFTYLAFVIIALIISACGGGAQVAPTDTPTPQPTNTPLTREALPPTWTPAPSEPTPAPTATGFVVDPVTGVVRQPPINLTTPPEWLEGFDTIVYSDMGELAYVPFALYTGPVTGGTGNIVVLWDYVSVVNPLDAEFSQPTPWLDGLRLLRTLVVERTCNIGTGPQRTYRVGDREGIGTSFSAVDCDVANIILPDGMTPTPIPDALPDTRGWFAALNVDGMNMAFYVYTDPIDAMDGSARAELQGILDSITFHVGEE